jgi:ATP-dependent DNA helicase PIF1
LLSEYNVQYATTGLPEIPNYHLGEEEDRERTAYSTYARRHNFSYEDVEQNISQLNADQRGAYDRIMAAVYPESGYDGPTFFFVDGPGGTGKTFLWKTLLLKVRMDTDTQGESPVALAMASSGIAAQLLPVATTVHKRFLLPISDDLDNISIPVEIDSGLAKLHKRAKLIVWDEAPCMHAQQLDAIDKYLRDLMGVDKPFGGKAFVIGGDFRQTGPVVRDRQGRDVRVAQVAHTLTSARVWRHVTTLRLTTNMRVQNCMTTCPRKAQKLQEFIRTSLAIGDGTYKRLPDNVPEHWRIPLPDDIVWKPNESQEHTTDVFFEFMYGESRRRTGESDAAWQKRRNHYLWSTAVLVPCNDEATDINNRLLDTLLDGDHATFLSDNAMKEAEVWEHDWTDEFLSNIKESALPPHEIRLKVGAPIIAMRNIAKGVSNGTRLVVTYIDPNLTHIKARVLSERGGLENEVFIARLRLTVNMGGYLLERTQLPIRLAYVMTIHKSQGLTLKKVGLYLNASVFAHGQLYVGISRCGDPDNLFVYGQLDSEGRLWTNNIVYREILPTYDDD